MSATTSDSGTTVAQQAQLAVPRVHPWIRFWARLFDVFLFSFAFGMVAAFLAASAPTPRHVVGAIFDGENQVWYSIVALFAWVPVEAILLTTFGTTPGKWLFKIRLIPRSGSLPTFREALTRSIAVWWRGLGAGIPVVSVLTLIFAQARLRENGITSWDRDDGFTVVHERIGAARGLAACVLFLGALSLVVWGDTGRTDARPGGYEFSGQEFGAVRGAFDELRPESFKLAPAVLSRAVTTEEDHDGSYRHEVSRPPQSAVAASARRAMTILTRSEDQPVDHRLAFLKQSLLAGESTVIMHGTENGNLLIAELLVDADGIVIITTRDEAVDWAKALAEAGDAEIIAFKPIAADLSATEMEPDE